MSLGRPRDENDRLRIDGRMPDPEDGARATVVCVPSDGWPSPPDPLVYHGLAGRIVGALDPHTESDPMAILVQLLAAFGSAIGRGPHFLHEATRHPPCLNVVLVGQSSKARKGTSLQHVRALLGEADPEWAKRRIISGLSSGEGLINAVRDDKYERRPRKEGTKIVGYDDVLVEAGELDKRLLVLESEFARVLQAASRDGSTLSAVIREAWDSGNLNVMTKSPVVATHAHIAIIGHITRDELLRLLSRTESANGFANRFLWLCVRRSKLLAEGGTFTASDGAGFVRELKEALTFSRKLGESAIVRDEEARTLWRTIYPELTADVPGMVGSVLGRAEAQVARLSLLYALLDLSAKIKVPHLVAALKLWEYVERSVAYVFGESTGDPLADRVLTELRVSPTGLTRSELRDRFARNRSSDELSNALKALERLGLARLAEEPRGRARGAGRPTERWIAAGSRGYAINAFSSADPSAEPILSDFRVSPLRPKGPL